MKKTWLLFIIFFSVITFISTSALLFGNSSGTFFTIDPDVHYLSNSFLFILRNKIVYNVHPGAPTIMLFAYALTPLRLYARYILNTPFASWSFQNLHFTYHYVRYFQSLLLAASMCTFLLVIYRITKSQISIIIGWLALFTFGAFPFFGVTIVPETFSFFLVSLWLLAFTYFVKSHSRATFVLMSLLSGIALANKFTNIPLVIISPLLVLTISDYTLKQKLSNMLLSFVIIIFCFVAATWPARQSYPQMFQWITTLATTSGLHGGGEKTIFDLTSYIISVKTLITRETKAFYLIIGSFLLVFFGIARKKIKLISPLAITSVVTIGSFAIASKFSLSHYQLTNYVLTVFIGIVFLKYLPSLIQILIVLLLIPIVSTNINQYYANISGSMQKAMILEEYIENNPPKKATVWGWGRSKDFAILWGLPWTGGVVFEKELTIYKPNLYELDTDLQTIKIRGQITEKISSACWDQLYLSESTVKAFLSKNSDMLFDVIQLHGTDDMVLLKSKHCLTL